jgi:8-oxo-dGTP pyrophosphatase MutT (NUDIX family)
MDRERQRKLRMALAGFSPTGPEQEQALAQMERLLAGASGDPFHRAHLEPGHFTASGFVLSEDGDSVLLVFHRKLQRWLQPGGHFEAADGDHLDAARREVAEEVGVRELDVVSPLHDLDVHTIPGNSREGAHLHFDLRVLFRCRQADFQASDEVAAARYFRLEDLARGDGPAGSDDIAGSDDSVARVARRLLVAR